MWTLSCGSLYRHVGFCILVLYRVSFSVLFSSSPSCCLFFLFHLLINWFFLSLSLFVTHSLLLAHSFSHSLTRTQIDKHLLASFPWQAWDNVHCQGVGCTPWYPSDLPCLPPLTCRYSGVEQCVLPRGRMYTLASLRRPSGVRLICEPGVR